MTKSLAAALALLIAAAPAGAVEWQAMGPRALGMGGAGVAMAQGPLAAYWNPAALGRATENAYGLAVPFGVHAALTGTVVEGAKDLQNLRDAGGSATQAQIDEALNKLNDKNDGLRINALGGANFKVGKIAVFANGFVDMGAIPVVDLGHDTAGTINANTSKLVVKGARVTEIGAGYGHELPFAPGVFLGGNLKVMNAQVGYADYSIISNGGNGNNDLLKTLKNGAKTSSNFGVDLGALWDVDRTFPNAKWQPRVGLTGRNLNNPKFKLPDSAFAAGYAGKYSINPQLRLGGAISPFNWWHLATDIDLTRNLTPVDGVASREFGLGTEVDVFNRTWINIPLRFGLARNLANTGAGTMLTAGTGINLLHFMLDLSGEYSPQSIQTQSQGKSEKIPKELGAAVSISILFGGSDDHDRAAPPAPPAPAAAPADPKTVTPAQADQIKKDADKAQQDMSKESAKPQ
ncbi:MAG: conjugal transfer protein TraF [Elusimicrobia bacterium]|nr:conjugal transfer protein TraF [Elusimicrobiota bacterium]